MSGTLFHAASDAPPARKLCIDKFFPFSPKIRMCRMNSSRAVVYDIPKLLWAYTPDFVATKRGIMKAFGLW